MRKRRKGGSNNLKYIVCDLKIAAPLRRQHLDMPAYL